MGIKTQESTSLHLSSTYNAYYKEFQIRNWTSVGIVVTEFSGEQFWLPPSQDVRESEASVEIERRVHNGMRAQQTQFGMKDVPIKCTKTTISFDTIRSKPLKLNEFGIIISTFDHANVAKAMLHESLMNPIVYETRVDAELVDPRLVFQVIDPSNKWSELYVNVFGQTLIVRAGHFNHDLPFEQTDTEQIGRLEDGILVCYLRYPHQYYNGAEPVTTVFEISLENVEKGEPILLPSGDIVCVAPTVEGLQMLLAKKAAGNVGRVPSNCISEKMVSKEMFDAAKKNFDDEIARLKETHRTELETLKTNNQNTVSKLNIKIVELEHDLAMKKEEISHWQNLSQFKNKVETDSATVREAEARARKEEAEAARKEIERLHTTLKVAGAVVVGIITFATTVLVKTKKK